MTEAIAMATLYKTYNNPPGSSLVFTNFHKLNYLALTLLIIFSLKVHHCLENRYFNVIAADTGSVIIVIYEQLYIFSSSNCDRVYKTTTISLVLFCQSDSGLAWRG